MSNPLPSSIEPFQVVKTYVFKEESPNIQVFLNFLKNKNKFALVNISTENGYTTITTTNTASVDSCGGCACCACTCCNGSCL